MSETDEQIYRRIRGDLVRYATVLVGPTAAEDIVAIVVLRTLSRHRLADLDEPRPYLFRAVLNQSRTLIASTRLHASIHNNLGNGLMEVSPDLHPEILTAVLALPTQQRAATYLTYWVGTNVRETSELMGVRPGTIKRYLFLARRTLKGVLKAND